MSHPKEDDGLETFLTRGRDEGVYPGAVAAFGTVAGIDRVAVLLTNQVYGGEDTGLIRFRERFHAMVAAGRFD